MSSLKLATDLVVIGTGEGEGTGPTVVMSSYRESTYSSDRKPIETIFFNCGECACRCVTGNEIKLNHTSAALFTRAAPAHVSGLPSLVFAMSEAGTPSLAIEGPSGIRGYVSSIGCFVSRRYPEIKYCDDIATLPRSHSAPASTRGAFTLPLLDPDLESNEPGAGVHASDGWPATVRPPLSVLVRLVHDSTSETRYAWAKGSGIKIWSVAMAHTSESFVDHATPPQLSTKRPRLEEAGPGAGSTAAALSCAAASASQNWSSYIVSITGPAGAGVTKEQVIAVIDCPSASDVHVRGTLAAVDAAMRQLRAQGSVGHSSAAQSEKPAASTSASAASAAEPSACLIVHLSPSHIVGLPAYQRWVSVRSGSQHVFLQRAASARHSISSTASAAAASASASLDHVNDVAESSDVPVAVWTHFPAATAHTAQLHAVDGNIFPLLVPRVVTSSSSSSSSEALTDARPGTSARLFPDVSALNHPEAINVASIVTASRLKLPQAAVKDAELMSLMTITTDSVGADFNPTGGSATSTSSGFGTSAAATVAAASKDVNKAAAAALRRQLLLGTASSSAPAPPSSQAPTAPSSAVVSATTAAPSASSSLPDQPSSSAAAPYASINRPPGCASLMFLGTGAAAPSKRRSCSSIYVSLGRRGWERDAQEQSGNATSATIGTHLPAARAICDAGTAMPTADAFPPCFLLDCGEGTLSKLELLASSSSSLAHTSPPIGDGVIAGSMSTVNSSLLDLVLSIRLIWISHMHADHHTGLLQVMMMHARARSIAAASASASALPQLSIAGPPALFDLLKCYDEVVHRAGCDEGWLPTSTSSAAAPFTATFTFFDITKPDAAQLIIASFSATSTASEVASSGCDASKQRPCTAVPAWVPVSWQNIPVEHSRDARGCAVTLAPLSVNSHGASIAQLGASSAEPTSTSSDAAPSVARSQPDLICSDNDRIVLVYSGDTRPCDRLVGMTASAASMAHRFSAPVNIASPSGADLGSIGSSRSSSTVTATSQSSSQPSNVGVLLIHEATFNDDRTQDAIKKRHSTVGEAIAIAGKIASACDNISSASSGRVKAKLNGLLLTHFSQRYPSLGSVGTDCGNATAGSSSSTNGRPGLSGHATGDGNAAVANAAPLPPGVPSPLFACDLMHLPLDQPLLSQVDAGGLNARMNLLLAASLPAAATALPGSGGLQLDGGNDDDAASLASFGV